MSSFKKNKFKQLIHTLFQQQPLDQKTLLPYDALTELGKELHLQKSEFISESDSITEIAIILLENIKDKTAINDYSKLNCLDEIFTDEEKNKIIADIVEYFDSIPRNYLVRFVLPNITWSERTQIKVNDNIILKFDQYVNNLSQSSKFFQDSSVDSKNAINSSKQYYLSIDICHSGLLAFNKFEKPFSILKQFIYLGISKEIFIVNTNHVSPHTLNSSLKRGGFLAELARGLDPLSNYFEDEKNQKKTYIILSEQEITYLHQIEINPQFSSGATVIEVLEWLSKDFCALHNERTSSDKNKILSGLEWAFESDVQYNETFKFILKCIGLEAILGDDKPEQTTLKLANRCAYQLAVNHKERKELLSRFKKIYDLRSKLVHGSRVSLNPNERGLLSLTDDLLKRILFTELEMVEI